jgi:hypothetical protein
MALRREHGAEQPYIPLGIFKLRIPFVHFGWEWPEAVQGAFLVSVPMGSIAVHQEMLGVPFELAILMVALNGLLYILHPMFGDPLFPGWITPAIPLVTAWGRGFPEGPARIQAIIALQYCMAIVFLFMGISGLAKKIVSFVPNSMRAGIILGAGIAAMISVIDPNSGRMVGKELSVLVGTAICYLIMSSWRFFVAKEKSAFLKQLSKYGMLPGMIVAFIVGIIFKEVPIPEIEMGMLPFSRFGEIISGYTWMAVGFPPAATFVKALPLVFACYIIAFGDFVLAEVVTKDADTYRDDEVIDFNGNRSNIISGFRNALLATIAPYGPLSGPLWAGGTIAAAERYKQGRDGMDSIYGGVSSYILAMWVASLFMPVVSLFKPILPLGLSLTMTVQAFACCYIPMEMVQSKEERGVAGVMGIMLASRGAAWGIAAGVLLHLIIGVRDEFKEKPAA